VDVDDINVKTDASKFFAKLKDDKIDYIFVDDVTRFYLDEEKLFSTGNNPTTVVIKFNGDDLEIYYNNNGVVEFLK